MENDITQTAASQIVDLTGLPEPVVRDIRQLVQTIREKLMADKPASEGKPRQPRIGCFAEPGLSIPKEEIDRAQREAWANFPREFPGPNHE